MAQSNAVLLITGPSGSGKTSLLTTAADYLWEQHKLVLRMATADGGGWGSRVQAYVNRGLIQIWYVRSRWAGGNESLIEETLAKAAQGFWPAQMTDPLKGECVPGSLLLPPSTLIRTFKCKVGHLLVKTSGALQPTECIQCGMMVPLTQGVIETFHVPTPGFEKIGGYSFEGITSWSDIQMDSLSNRRAKNELHGEKSSIGGFTSGDQKFDGNNRADYGFAQTQAPRWINFMSQIPGLKIPPILTGLETTVDDNGTSNPYWAPAIAGQARSGMVPQWVGNYLGTSWIDGGVNEDGSQKRIWRLHTTPYKGEDNKTHIYKTRAADAGLIPEILTDGDGEPFSGFSLNVFFKLLNQATAKTEEAINEKYKDAPGPPAATVDPVAMQAAIDATMPQVAVGLPAQGLPQQTPQAGGVIGGPTILAPAASPIKKKSSVVVVR